MRIYLQPLEGLNLKNPGAPVGLTFDDDHFIIEELGLRKRKTFVEKSFKISLNSITGTLLSTEKEILEIDKSVVGRGVAGGLLLGPAGLFLGGLSGVGKKQKTSTNHVYGISYVSAGGDTKGVSFSVYFTKLKEVQVFDEALKASMGELEEAESSEVFL